MREVFAARADGSVEARLTADEAEAVHRIAADMSDVLGATGEDPSLERLFPVAYPDDAAGEEEFEGLTRDDLVAGKVRAARAVVRSIESGSRRRGRWTGVLGEEDQRAWLTTLNDARLVLGTRLDVTEDMDHTPLPFEDPRAPAHNLYLYLSGLQELLIETLLGGLPDAPSDDRGEPWG